MSAAAVACWSALIICNASAARAQPQPETSAPVSVERIGEALKAPAPAGLLNLANALPIATFRTRVDQRVYMLTFEELLRKEFALTPLQQQSQDWYGRCCGINLVALINSLDKKLKRREERRIREQVLRELAQLRAAARERQ